MEKTEQDTGSCLWFHPKDLEDVIYLDNAATTYHKPEQVYRAMEQVSRCLSVNAGRGSYALAQTASEGIEALRQELADFIQAGEETEVVFTPSATHAFNQIIGGMTFCSQDRVYVSPFEHNAVMRTLYERQLSCGFTIEELPLNVEKLEIDLDKCEYLFHQKPPTHVFVTQISNVTGYLLPLEEILTLAKKASREKALVVVDGAQALGLIEVDSRKLPFDAYVFAGHKTLYAPFGIAGFYKRRGLRLGCFFTGGTGSDSLSLAMPKGNLEPGSPNMIGVAGLYGAVQFIKEAKVSALYGQEKKLTMQLINGLRTVNGIRLYLPENMERHVGIVSFSLAGYEAGEVGMLLDEEYHIAVRTGYHCVPLIHKYLGEANKGGTVRMSVSYFTAPEEIQKAVAAVQEIGEG